MIAGDPLGSGTSDQHWDLAQAECGAYAGTLVHHPSQELLYIRHNHPEELGVVVWNTVTFEPVGYLPVGDSQSGMAIHPDGSRLYLEDESSLATVDLDSGDVVDRKTLRPTWSRDRFVLDSEGSRLYCGPGRYGDAHEIFAFDTEAMESVERIRLPELNIQQFVLHPDGSKLFVVHRPRERLFSFQRPRCELVSIDLSSHEVLERAEISTDVDEVAINPDGLTLYVTGDGNWVWEYDSETLAPQYPNYEADERGEWVPGKYFGFGGGYRMITLHPTGRYAFFLSEEGDDVLYTVKTDRGLSGGYVVGRQPTTPEPAEMLSNPAGSRLFITNKRSSLLTIVNTSRL